MVALTKVSDYPKRQGYVVVAYDHEGQRMWGVGCWFANRKEAIKELRREDIKSGYVFARNAWSDWCLATK